MKIDSLFLCIASCLLTSSGGLNIGLSGFAAEPLRLATTAVGFMFIFLGSIGMGMSFCSLFKSKQQVALG